MTNKKLLLSLCATAVLAGCASPKENVIFVTKTSLGIDFDGTPPAASIAYDRTEGYIGPRFENGAVPPVVAKISTDGGIFNRNVKQYYATGTASNMLTGSTEKASGTWLEGKAEPMFFGTQTTLGIKIGFTTTYPDSFVFGYKRKEASLIPLGHFTDTSSGTAVVKHAYPSVIGVFTTDTKAKTPSDSEFGLAQFFATGASAEALASDPDLQKQFKQFAKDAVSELKETIRLQQETVLGILTCFSEVPDEKIIVVADAAKYLALYAYDSDYDDITKALKEKAPPKARSAYSKSLANIKADAPDRQGKLEGHAAHVCSLKPPKE